MQTQWNTGGQAWQSRIPNNPTNPQSLNPALPATLGARPPFIRNPINNNQSPGPRPPVQLNASDTIEASEPNPDEPIDPDAPINDSTFSKDEEVLRANCFRSLNKPWIDVPLDVQERR
ncbi:hypothetical protein C0992_008905 [Termitomyces sp. T32_za158]|nr:hypothetical protein C0992_008905 [Termitomyces sp. T32_za158]